MRLTINRSVLAGFVSPGFWHRLLTPEKMPPVIDELPVIHPNHMREISDHWWDYSKAMIWQRSLWIEAFERSGGGLLRERIERLEHPIQSLDRDLPISS